MKKKILFINGHLNTGGVEKALLDVLTHLDYDRYNVDLLLLEHLGNYANQLPPQVNVMLRSIEGTYGPLAKVIKTNIRNRDWLSLKMRWILLLVKLFGQNWIGLAKQLLTNGTNYDCVIGFRPGLCTQIAAFATNADRRITWWHHGEINIDQKTYIEASRHCDCVIVVSDSCRRMLAKEFPMLADKLITIPNMIDIQSILYMGNLFDPYPDKDVLHIVSVGRLAPEKHFENAISTARQLKDRGYVFRWHLVGDGMLRDELRQKADELDVSDCFIFEGNQVNPYPYIKHADLFVHPSYVESFGIVVTEALALGVPCVVSESMGVMDFLVDGKNAIVAEPSPASLAEKVVEALQNNELRAWLHKNAHCPEAFLPAVVMNKIDDLLI